MAGGGGPSKGTQLAIGIVLLWFGGLCLFVAFLSGKIPQLTDSTDSSGTAHGPSDISGLLASVASAAQQAQYVIPTPPVGQTQPITEGGVPVGTVTNTGGGGWIVGSGSDF